ncbi:hypothetical protein H4582DRAFT_2171072 [Lactarius indigo]|nr:hypothetical protein H4582DRAFT_2171072 [Lactarius indigo]
MPSLTRSPSSTISLTSQSSISISLRRRTTTTSMLHLPRGRRPASKTISHISIVPLLRSPGCLPSLPSPDIRRASSLGRCDSIISELDMPCTDLPVLLSFPRMSEMHIDRHHPAQCLALLPNAPHPRTLDLSADNVDLPYAFLDDFLAARACTRLTHVSLPHFVACPLQRTTSHPPLLRTFTVLDSSPGLAAALTYLRLLRRVTLRIPSALYNDLRPVALYSALGGSLRELVLVLAPDVGIHTRGRLLGAQENTDAGLEVLELSLDSTSDEVSLQVLYKQVSSLLSNVQALRTLRLQASLPTEAAEADGGSLRLVLWMRSPLGSALFSIVFPSEAHWEPEWGE